jgi:indole-3-glycerol phosphate synthase
MSATRLDPILASVRARAAARRARTSLGALRRETRPDPARRRRFVSALCGDGLAFLAELKRRSPSAGTIRADGDVLERARAYAAGGAAALSVLTEEDHFSGSPEDLARVAAAGLPRLRKDFLLDEGMVLESIAMGADAILLLAVCLPDPLLGELRSLAGDLGLAVLLEVHDERELERAIAVEPDCIGVNARDLASFRVDLATSERILPVIPESFVRVAESGLSTLDGLRRVRRAGADAALVGEALMRAEDPGALLRSWKVGLVD